MRTILAFLIAPASFGILLFGLSLFTSTASEGIWALRFSTTIAYPLALVVWVPMYLLMSKYGVTGFLSYALMSLVFATLLIAYFVVRPVYLDNDGDLSTLFMLARILQMVVFAFASFLTLSIFWLIARPDKVAG